MQQVEQRVRLPIAEHRESQLAQQRRLRHAHKREQGRERARLLEDRAQLARAFGPAAANEQRATVQVARRQRREHPPWLMQQQHSCRRPCRGDGGAHHGAHGGSSGTYGDAQGRRLAIGSLKVCLAQELCHPSRRVTLCSGGRRVRGCAVIVCQ